MDEGGFNFVRLRDKWREVPQEGGRVYSDQLIRLDQSALFTNWKQYFARYRSSEPDRWYQTLYQEFMRGKKVLEIGSGLGFDGILRLQEGLVEEWTFCDVVESNLCIIQRICEQFGLSADFMLIDDDFECFDKLATFDVIWANGSLLHVPFEVARAECMKILPHLKPGGRWIELSYPQRRWIREGRLPFSEWGRMTDGERTPWVEWYDLIKLKRRLFPAPFEVILDFNFANDVYNWFDLMLAGDAPFDAKQTVIDIDVYPSGANPETHGDSVILDRAGVLDVITPEPVWSYAASFDLVSAIMRSNLNGRQLDNGFTIEVELLVTEGHIGVLVVGDDIGASVCREHFVAANTEPTTLLITVPAQAGGRRLIFRNAAASARSALKLQSVMLRFVSAALARSAADRSE